MEELDTTFQNAFGRQYTVTVTVAIAHQFCKENKIRLEGLNPLLLDISQLLDLAYMASRSSKTKALGETKEEFLEGLEGEAFSLAQDRAVNALVNFSLKTLPQNQAVALRKELARAQLIRETAQQGSSESEPQSPGEESGTGETSSGPAEPPALIPSTVS